EIRDPHGTGALKSVLAIVRPSILPGRSDPEDALPPHDSCIADPVVERPLLLVEGGEEVPDTAEEREASGPQGDRATRPERAAAALPVAATAAAIAMLVARRRCAALMNWV